MITRWTTERWRKIWQYIALWYWRMEMHSCRDWARLKITYHGVDVARFGVTRLGTHTSDGDQLEDVGSGWWGDNEASWGKSSSSEKSSKPGRSMTFGLEICMSMLSYIYPHKPLLKIPITRLTSHFLCGLMSNPVICNFRSSMVIQDTKCPYWDQVVLSNTNQTKPNSYC